MLTSLALSACRSTGDQHAYQSSRDIRNGFDAIVEAVEPPPRVEPPPGQQRAASRRRRILLTAFSRNRQSKQSAFIFPSRYAPTSNARTCRAGLSTACRSNVRLLLQCSPCRVYVRAHHALAIGLTAHRPARHPTCTLDTSVYGDACGPHLYLPTCALHSKPIFCSQPCKLLRPRHPGRVLVRLRGRGRPRGPHWPGAAWAGGMTPALALNNQMVTYLPTRFRCTGTAVMPAAV